MNGERGLVEGFVKREGAGGGLCVNGAGEVLCV